jgi:RimJ/RimL family protein N-acetyltransferase
MKTDAQGTDRPVGEKVLNWVPPAVPCGEILSGCTVRLEPLDADKHAAALYPAYIGHDFVWDYLPYGPFDRVEDYHAWIRDTVANPSHFFYAVQDVQTGDFVGVASYLRIDPSAGSIEVGNINFAPALQRTAASTEAMYLMMKWAFEAGYRRYEWKCNALNAPSRRSAQRLGFSYEGVFRQALIVKGRNRDTAWFAAIDSEWPALNAAFTRWLSPENFDDAGRQINSLTDWTAPVLVATDPTISC